MISSLMFIWLRFTLPQFASYLSSFQTDPNPEQKSELKNKLNDVHQEISNRTQKQLKAFAEENSEIKQPDSEPDRSMKR